MNQDERKSVRVVIADDHEVVRIGLRTLLQRSNEGYELVGEVSSGNELLKLLASTSCDMVIVDFQMPEDVAPLDGVMLLRELRGRFPRLRIVVMTMLRNLAIFRTMYREGANAVVEKAAVVDEFFTALRTVRAGRTYMSKRFCERLADYALPAAEPRAEAGKQPQALSLREVEVVRLLAQGSTVSEVARITRRSVKTISWQKHSAMAKLGLTNDQQLFDYARTSGLL